MSPERWREIRDIFLAALECEPAQRAEFVGRASGNDEDLRVQVESLLAAHEKAGSFIEEPFIPNSLLEQPPADEPEDNFQGTGRFSLTRRLGAGGFGVVYQAYDKKKRADVALKVLRKFDPAALYRFKREFRSLANVAHQNLVTLYELICEEERWFFTMELVRGSDFLDYVLGNDDANNQLPDYFDKQGLPSSAARLSRSLYQTPNTKQKPAEEQDGAGIPPVPHMPPKFNHARFRAALTQLAAGVQALHESGKLHRDLKPSNVLVTAEGRVVILDFGLTTELTPADTAHSLTLIGTPAYMAPEQAGSEPLTEASDWYSVGVMLYEALTGTLPFSGRSLESLKKKQLQEAPDPAQIAEGLPEDIASLCRDLLRRDPTERPSGREILSRLGHPHVDLDLHGDTPAPHPRLNEIPVVGRDSQLNELRDAFTVMKAGRPVVVHVSGRSGVGKSTLVHHFLDQLRQSEKDVVILTGRCYEQESVPYKAVDSLIDALSKYLKLLSPSVAEALLPRDVLALAKLFPVLSQAKSVATARRRVLDIPDSQELRRRAFAALRDLIGRLSDKKAVVLFIDDLQWGDVDSILLLEELLRPPDPPSLLLINGFRAEDIETSLPLQMLLQFKGTRGDAVQFHDLAIKELSAVDARRLTAMLLSQWDISSDRLADLIVGESDANPFFIHQLIRYLINEGAKQKEEGKGSTYDHGNLEGVTLSQTVLSRIQSLPKAARRLLRVVAVAGQPIPLEVANSATNLGPSDHNALAILRAEHLIRIRNTKGQDEIETYHDRVREVITGNLSQRLLRTYHYCLAHALETYGQADAEALALHFREAGELNKAARYASVAAEHAANALAFDRAARLYKLAIELRPPAKDEAAPFLSKLGDALVNAGRGAEAADVYLSAAEHSRAAEKLKFQQLAAEQLLRSGHVDEGLKVIHNVLHAVGMKMPSSSRRALMLMLLQRAQIRLHGLNFRERDASNIPDSELALLDSCWSVAVGISMVDPIIGSYFNARYLRLALKAGEPYRVALALAMETAYRAIPGRRGRESAEELSNRALRLAKRIDNPHALALATLMSGVMAYLLGEWKRSLKLSVEAEQILRERCTGVAWELGTAHTFHLVARTWLGDWGERSRQLKLILKEAQERGDLHASTSLPLVAFSYLTHLANDEPEEAQRELRDALERWSVEGFDIQHSSAFFGEVETAIYSGDGKASWELVKAKWPSLKRSMILRIQTMRVFSLHMRARSALAAATDGQPPASSRRELLRIAAHDATRIEREQLPWALPLVQLIRAGINSIHNMHEDALALLQLAVDGFEAADMMLYAQAACRRYGEIAGGQRGQDMMSDANIWMVKQDIKNTERITKLLAPGL